MVRTPEDIVSDLVRNILSRAPPATLSLGRQIDRLHRPAASHANWRGLSDFLLAELFRRLPVPDLVRLGYLFNPRWREIWRREPLYLHDRQFASLHIPRSQFANAIANVLDDYVEGIEDEAVQEEIEKEDEYVEAAKRRRGVYSFRVESMEWGPEHAARWCAALRRGKAFEVVLFNRGSSGQPPMLVHLPSGLQECTTVRVLHLAFFTVESEKLDALIRTTVLGLHGCACPDGVIEGVVAAFGNLEKLWVHDGAMATVVVRSAPRLLGLSMRRTGSRSLTVDDVPSLLELIPGSTAALSISRAPKLASLDLPGTTLKIDGVVIEVGRQAMEPQMPSVRALWLALNYTALRGMEEGGHMVPRVVRQMMMRFPLVECLVIERKDDVPQEEGMAPRDDPHTHGHLDLYDGLEGVAWRLRTLTFFDFRAGKAELKLLKALMDRTHALATVELVYIEPRHDLGHENAEAHVALHQFLLRSTNQSLRNYPFQVHIYFF